MARPVPPSRIENYLGFPSGISGSDLAERAALQARKFGARLVVPARATGLTRDGDHFAIALESGEEVKGRTVIVASGAQYRKLDLPDLERWEGDRDLLRGDRGRGPDVLR